MINSTRGSLIDGLIFATALYGAALGGVLLAHVAHADTAEPCDPAYTAQCCACAPSDVAEPDPLPKVYLPSVQLRMASMPPPEFTPFVPAPQLQPERPVLRWVWLALVGK